MKKLLFLILLSVCCCNAFSQNYWFSNGTQFQLSTMAATNTAAFILQEGSAMIDDASGNPYLVCDGKSLYKNSSGWSLIATLIGDITAAQSALILRQPSSANMYYIFVVQGWQNVSTGLSYYTYNSSTSTLSGATLLDGLCMEQLTSVCDGGNGYWVVSHRTGTGTKTSNKYVAFHLTSSGLNTSPVVSNGKMKYPANSISTNRYGMLTFSEQNNVLCNTFGGLPVADNSTVEMINFNTITGVFSNPKILLNATSSNPKKAAPNAYSAAFSPNGNVLYLASVIGSAIYQYNLTAGSGWFATPAAVANSRFSLSTSLSSWHVKLNRTNGIIYGVSWGWSTLSTISTPNLTGAACSFSSSSVALPAFNKVSFTQTPAPSCSCNLTAITDVSNANICIGEVASLAVTVLGGTAPYTYLWSPAASLSCPTCNITQASPVTTTTYQVTITDALGCSITKNITINLNPGCCVCAVPANLQNGCDCGCPSGTPLSWTGNPCALSYDLSYTNLTTSLNYFVPGITATTYVIPSYWGDQIQWKVRMNCNSSQVSAYSTPQTFTPALCPFSCCRESGEDKSAASTPLVVYPNPATDNITVTFFSDQDHLKKIRVCDLSGKELLSETILTSAGKNEVALNIASLSSGTYLLYLPSANGISVIKWMKQ